MTPSRTPKNDSARPENSLRGRRDNVGPPASEDELSHCLQLAADFAADPNARTPAAVRAYISKVMLGANGPNVYEHVVVLGKQFKNKRPQEIRDIVERCNLGTMWTDLLNDTMWYKPTPTTVCIATYNPEVSEKMGGSSLALSPSGDINVTVPRYSPWTEYRRPRNN
ncbi:hypothetical protein SPRG_17285 [Saprolegnia parasitica CBS 223.65]|uniref:Uncharacterized protein n=1 Tax=Saprolegnia parasitica (strain CBS 223.65) TaxID=695850 RepID=A0A067BSN0_SAPPC|nr:hypothetical protein SPRG_17285 [Saprolegnia parasitica CBS 223.65]KDO17286.1 hypothetical protein SPRG_17285 [Saprolegnia parasitica CBS 223.65]|eukprot:XP_012212008.1 hypothetical protein SPRG_17285 [Saprolegnia parasitica CBS 223.65]